MTSRSGGVRNDHGITVSGSACAKPGIGGSSGSEPVAMSACRNVTARPSMSAVAGPAKGAGTKGGQVRVEGEVPATRSGRRRRTALSWGAPQDRQLGTGACAPSAVRSPPSRISVSSATSSASAHDPVSVCATRNRTRSRVRQSTGTLHPAPCRCRRCPAHLRETRRARRLLFPAQ